VDTESAATRPHTGRKRNEEVRRAILAAALRLLSEADGGTVSVDTIAREAGVGKQTNYRWWPSKGAVFLDALTEHAAVVVPEPDTGTLLGDLTALITALFVGASSSTTKPILTTLVRESVHDPHVGRMMHDFTQARRTAVQAILERGRARGELANDADLGLMTDQVHGVLWYRLLLGHAELDAAVAERLARGLTSGNAR
jgi:AcrR family transcriptional regulator